MSLTGMQEKVFKQGLSITEEALQDFRTLEVKIHSLIGKDGLSTFTVADLGLTPLKGKLIDAIDWLQAFKDSL